MRDAEQTRARLRSLAAELFNVHGYAGVSLRDIMRATNLQKGGIYHHVGSKEQLAVEAFDVAAGRVHERLAQEQQRHDDGVGALIAFVELFRGYFESPPLRGGCPILNTAIESDDTNPILRARVQAVVDEWRATIRQAVARGRQRGEISASVDGDALATLMIATLEGGLMLAKLYGDRRYLDHAADHLRAHIDQRVRWGG
jgi:TetR/AcrR family transcriptional regulator, transcriptional repressor for nem operon